MKKSSFIFQIPKQKSDIQDLADSSGPTMAIKIQTHTLVLGFEGFLLLWQCPRKV